MFVFSGLMELLNKTTKTQGGKKDRLGAKTERTRGPVEF